MNSPTIRSEFENSRDDRIRRGPIYACKEFSEDATYPEIKPIAYFGRRIAKKRLYKKPNKLLKKNKNLIRGLAKLKKVLNKHLRNHFDDFNELSLSIFIDRQQKTL
jgi:hypothetical protein